MHKIEMLDVRSDSDIPALKDMIGGKGGCMILIYADWCGHCHKYMPFFENELEKIPGRTVNMAKVHYDMQDKIPEIKDAKIQGYPSVIKVTPTGKLEEYNVDGEKTNAISSSEMRDKEIMKRKLIGTQQGGKRTSTRKMKGGQRGGQHAGQHGGELVSAFLGAIQTAGPAALLLLAHGALSSKQKGGFRSPKRQTRRNKTRRNHT